MKKIIQNVLMTVTMSGALMAAQADTPFFSDKKAETKQEAEQQAAFQKELQRVNEEKKSMLEKITTDSVAPQVTEYRNNNIDIEAIAKRYEKGVIQQQKGERVYIFATLDMPKATLKKLVTDVRKVDGAVVLRGFYEGSYKKTYQKIQELGLTDGNIQINPSAFHKYKINQAPSFVVVKKLGANESLDLDGCVLPDEYIKITGDVSLAYALEKMAASVKNASDREIIEQQLGKL